MAALPEPLLALIAALGKLPGVGPRSAERIALHLVQNSTEACQHLAATLLSARQNVANCRVCGALTEQQPCGFCSDPRRDGSIICVVERAVDILSIEKSGAFKGLFHVLGGKISPLDGIEPEDLKIRELAARLQKGLVKELIIALPSDVEGDATSFYLSKHFSTSGIRVSRIAHGLPAGSGLEFADELTLTRALEGRREFA